MIPWSQLQNTFYHAPIPSECEPEAKSAQWNLTILGVFQQKYGIKKWSQMVLQSGPSQALSQIKISKSSSPENGAIQNKNNPVL